MLSGIPIFPISWNNPPTSKSCKSLSDNPRCLPINTEYWETRSEWPLVYVSFASTVYLNVWIVDKYASSSFSFLSDNSSLIFLISFICAIDFIPDSINNSNWSNLSLFSQYPWMSSLRIVSSGGAKSLWPVNNRIYNSLLNFLISSTTWSPWIGVIIKSSNIKS